MANKHFLTPDLAPEEVERRMKYAGDFTEDPVKVIEEARYELAESEELKRLRDQVMIDPKVREAVKQRALEQFEKHYGLTSAPSQHSHTVFPDTMPGGYAPPAPGGWGSPILDPDASPNSAPPIPDTRVSATSLSQDWNVSRGKAYCTGCGTTLEPSNTAPTYRCPRCGREFFGPEVERAISRGRR
jgi:predicted RNA-binding Zn-ribbon protein involved in translation (DUF1610 family)